MTTKTIRIWDGCRVVQLITVSEHGTATSGGVGGAENSSRPDIEIDPWAKLIVDHETGGSPVYWPEDGIHGED